jgi:hypothetical protein
MPSKLENVTVYLEKDKKAWLTRQARKARISLSQFILALIVDKMEFDEDFCPSPSFVNLSAKKE